MSCLKNSHYHCKPAVILMGLKSQQNSMCNYFDLEALMPKSHAVGEIHQRRFIHQII